MGDIPYKTSPYTVYIACSLGSLHPSPTCCVDILHTVMHVSHSDIVASQKSSLLIWNYGNKTSCLSFVQYVDGGHVDGDEYLLLKLVYLLFSYQHT